MFSRCAYNGSNDVEFHYTLPVLFASRRYQGHFVSLISLCILFSRFMVNSALRQVLIWTQDRGQYLYILCACITRIIFNAIEENVHFITLNIIVFNSRDIETMRVKKISGI